MKEKVMNGLEKFSKAMLSPLSYISAAGLILVLGALLTSTSLSAMIPVLQWTPIKLLGQLIYNCIMVIINNLSLMFCVGIAAALAKKNKQQAAIIGLMSYFMYLTAGNVTLTQLGMLAEADPMVGLYGTGQSTVFGIQTVDMGVFGGILLGLVCGWVYNRTCEKQFKGIITQIYSGNRWSFTCMVVFSILFGFGSCFFWPPVQNVISALTDLIATSGNFGLFLYGFLERFLIPTGLHHALNNVFWFDTIGLGDLSHFWAGETSADVSWSLGMYMSGFFPCMMFGVMGAALAMVKTAKNKKAAIGLVLSAAICAFVCGVTEPFEFGFMFLCFPLYVVYSALYGIFTIITYYSGFRAGFCFSAGATDLVFSASLPAAAKTWMIIPLGIAAFLVFYFVFYFAITKFDLKTPGREDDDEEAEKKVVLANNNYTEVASAVLAAVGGKENVKDVGYCATRLRFEVLDNAKVDEKAVKAAGAAGVIRPSKNACQVIIGTKVQFVYDELKKML